MDYWRPTALLALTNEEVFCDFIERNLLPNLLPFDGTNSNSIVILDNASIHHTKRVVELINSVGALVHFLPPYTPHLNPIEELFSKVKSCMKENETAILQADNDTLEDIILTAFSLVTSEDCYGWCMHAGYL